MSNTEVALFGNKETLPAHLQSSGATGNENVGQEDVALPRLKLLQKISAEVEDLGMEAAEKYYNTITGEVYKAPYVINLHYSREFAVFKDRKLGNEFQGTFDTEADALAHIETLDRPDDYKITQTGRHVLLLLDEEGHPVTPAVFNMSNTALQVSRMWNSQFVSGMHKDAPRYASVWQLGIKRMSNNAGSWVVPEPKQVGWVDEEMLAEVQEYYEQARNA